MKATGRIIQARQLLGEPRIEQWHQHKGNPYGELYVDDDGNPVAVVCHLKTVVEVPGLRVTAVLEGPDSIVKEVHYAPDLRPSARPGQGLEFRPL